MSASCNPFSMDTTVSMLNGLLLFIIFMPVGNRVLTGMNYLFFRIESAPGVYGKEIFFVHLA